MVIYGWQESFGYVGGDCKWYDTGLICQSTLKGSINHGPNIFDGFGSSSASASEHSSDEGTGGILPSIPYGSNQLQHYTWVFCVYSEEVSRVRSSTRITN